MGTVVSMSKLDLAGCVPVDDSMQVWSPVASVSP